MKQITATIITFWAANICSIIIINNRFNLHHTRPTDQAEVNSNICV